MEVVDVNVEVDVDVDVVINGVDCDVVLLIVVKTVSKVVCFKVIFGKTIFS